MTIAQTHLTPSGIVTEVPDVIVCFSVKPYGAKELD
jgi:hypothetical protein